MNHNSCLAPIIASNDVNADRAEKIFFCGGIFIVALTYAAHNILNLEQTCFLIKGFELSGVCFGVLFSILNFRAWKIFVSIYIEGFSQKEHGYRKHVWRWRVKLGTALLLKAVVICLFFLFLSWAHLNQILSFLFGFTAFLLVGMLLLGTFFVFSNHSRNRELLAQEEGA